MDINTEFISPAIGLMLIRWIVAATNTQVVRIERKVDAIMKHLAINWTASVKEQVEALAASGKRIEAIKRYRECTGEKLAASVAFVDALRRK